MASRDEILKAWDEAVANFGVAREGDLDVAASLALTLGFEVARSNRCAGCDRHLGHRPLLRLTRFIRRSRPRRTPCGRAALA
jgi:hypothetical protein